MAVEPTHHQSDNHTRGVLPAAVDAQTAAELIRRKLEQIYAQEPGALHELEEAESRPDRSKHQEFMYQLGTSGKDLATIQTEWHNYYQKLPDREKHVVWQEFYASQPTLSGQSVGETLALAEHKHQAATSGGRKRQAGPKLRDARSVREVQGAIRHNVTAGGQLKAKHHLQSLLFGLGSGLIVVVIFLFGFFNEVVIAPFIQPSRVATSTPLIVGNNSVAPTPNPEVIIPKINVEIPVNYTETSTNESVIENDLESGVVHYPTTVLPGELGNTAYFGHSSNNIFNKGKYKFAFVLLHTLVEGDTFYLTNNNKVYVYKVISRQIVEPNNVGVLGPVAGQTATATLITCDPPGTSLHRLIVVGQQISPDPSGNAAAATPAAAQTTAPVALPGNGPTLWTRIMHTGLGKVATVTLLAAALLLIVRRVITQIRNS
jgi:LPXTG-site transpeptidase (sortase) family protein